VWNKDYVYALGKNFSLVKNDTPQTPLKPIASSVTIDSVALTWVPVNEPDLLGYKVERYRDAETTPTSWTPAEDVASLIDNDFGLALKLKYRLYAMDTAGNLSGASADLVVRPNGSAPPTPTGLTAVSSDRRVDLTWIGVTDDDLFGYLIERCVLPACANWVSVNSVPITVTSFTDSGLANGTAYRYRVRATDTSNRQSSPSNTVDAQPQDSVRPARPVGVLAIALLDSSSIRITWEPNQDDDLASYHVFRSTVSGTPGVEVTLQDALDTSPVPDSMNYYTVIAADYSGNLSDPSVQVGAWPRSANGPTGLEAAFEVDDRGTPPFPPGTLSPDICETSYWFDDIVRVRLTWSTESGATYRIYRRGLTDTDFASIGTTTSSPYLDLDPPGYSFTYVVTNVLGAGESKGSNVAAAADSFTTNVANLYAADGRNLFPTENAPGRAAIISWSPVREKLLRGYHVYRRCARRDGDLQNVYACPMGSENAGGAEGNWCESRWIRLTDQPLSASPTTYQDSTLQGLEGCYTYMVRPVAMEPPLLEGPVTKAVLFYARSDADSGNFPVETVRMYNQHCFRDPEAWDRFLEPDCADGSALGDVCVNGHPRLNGAPGGPPQAPGGSTPDAVQVQKEVCTHHGYLTGGSCAASGNCVPDLHRELKGDMITWPQSPESDLKGYYIEKAGSASGPWVRITPHPIAWWETSYCVGATSVQILDGETGTVAGWSGMPRCDHYRVRAVDEEGNESPPTQAYEIGGPTAAECPQTPPAPQNFRIECNPYDGDCGLSAADCRVKLRWYQVPSINAEPKRYNVYRFVSTAANGPSFFYKTAEYESTDCCNHIETGDPVSCPYGDDVGHTRCDTGHLEAYYVTAQYRVNGSLTGESPPTRILYWDCSANGGQGGYSRFVAPSDEDSIELAETDEQDLVCRNEPMKLDLALPADVGDTIPSPPKTAATLVTDFLRAPMRTLGAPVDPPWIIQDLHTDHLGSVRLITDNGGNVVSQHDYFPFGEEAHSYAGVYNTHAFTGHERDGSGLDYMMARYYSAAMSRFLTVDPVVRPAPNASTPQRWNRYTYALNNSVRALDPTGEDVSYADDYSRDAAASAAVRVPQVLEKLFEYETNPTKCLMVSTGDLPTKVNPDGSFTETVGRTIASVGPGDEKPTTFMILLDKTAIEANGDDPAGVFTHELIGHVAQSEDRTRAETASLTPEQKEDEAQDLTVAAIEEVPAGQRPSLPPNHKQPNTTPAKERKK